MLIILDEKNRGQISDLATENLNVDLGLRRPSLLRQINIIIKSLHPERKHTVLCKRLAFTYELSGHNQEPPPRDVWSSLEK